ncbi:hypothetical protein ACFQ0M_09325 [Kitasatospora aburaviensis]
MAVTSRSARASDGKIRLSPRLACWWAAKTRSATGSGVEQIELKTVPSR